MSSAVRFAPSQQPPAIGAPPGGPWATLVPIGAPRRRRLGAGELALTATLFSLYVGVRGGVRLLGAIEGVVHRA
jgi:hypothetical protein